MMDGGKKMKKILALVLALCMMLTALPVFAETAESESEFSLDGMFENVLNEDRSTEGKTFKLLQLFSVLKEKLAGKGEAFSVIVSSLVDKLLSKLDDGGIISTLLTLLKSKLAGSDTDRSLGGSGEGGGLGDMLGGLLGGSGEGGDMSGLTDLLGGFLGGSETEGESVWTEEDEAELQAMADEMNEKVKNETGGRIANKKEVAGIEEFYGDWACTRFNFDGTDYDMLDSGVGVFIGENTAYITENGAKASDNTFADTVEMTLENNVLKVLSDGKWTAYCLTEDGELVDLGASLLFYYVPAGQAPQPVAADEVPAASESASSAEDEGSIGDLLSGLLGSSGENSGDLGGLGVLGGLLGGSGENGSSDLSGLTDMLGDLLGGSSESGSSNLGGLTSLVDGLLGESSEGGSGDLSGLTSMLGGLLGGGSESGSSDLGGLGNLLGGLLGEEAGEDGWSEEDTEDLQATLDRISERALNETGEGIENKKNVENIEEFYGTWICTRMILLGETYDMTGGDPFGIVIGENVYYNLEVSEDERPEGIQMMLENGVLKIFANGTWNAYVLTEDGELIETGENLQMVYIRGE